MVPSVRGAHQPADPRFTPEVSEACRTCLSPTFSFETFRQTVGAPTSPRPRPLFGDSEIVAHLPRNLWNHKLVFFEPKTTIGGSHLSTNF